jgi:hypothetical protein
MPPHLEGLAVELVRMIILAVDSDQDLYSLIQASRSFWQVFLTMKGKALQSLLVRNIGAGVFPDALGAATAATFGDRPHEHDRIPDLVKELELLRRVDYSDSAKILPRHVLISLFKMQRCVGHFVKEFADDKIAALHRYASFGQDSFSDPATAALEPSPLSGIEVARVQRAFYRFEIYRLLFSSKPTIKNSDSRPVSREPTVCPAAVQNRYYLSKLPMWQTEELACVRQYLVSRLIGVFFQLEDDFVHSVLSPTSYGSPFKRNIDFTREDFFFSRKNKEGGHSHGIEKLLSLGLPFLKKVFEATGQDQANLVIHNVKPSHDFLGKALRFANSRARMVEDAQAARSSNGSNLMFEGDFLNKPNEAWVWSEAYRLSTTFAYRCCDIRDWGYVFWDHERLEAAKAMENE